MMAEWRWDEAAHRYRAPNGRFLSPTTEAGLRAEVIAAQRSQMASLGSRFGAGDLSVTDFRAGMRDLIAQTNSLEFMFGRGGRNVMGPEDRIALRQIIADEWRYLDGFARQASFGGLSAAQIEARAQLYANATVRANAAGESAAWSGTAHQEINRLGTGDPCTQCPDLSALGWVPSGTLPLPGTRLCKANCGCHIERRVVAQAEGLRIVA